MKTAYAGPTPRHQPVVPCPVEVHTSLPPGIHAPVTAYLVLKISLFRGIQRAFFANRRSGSRNLPDELAVYVRWWGEPVNGPCAVFTPRLSHKAGHKQFTSTTARYQITVPVDRFKAYLKDMNVLYMNVVDSAHARIIGRARLDHVERLSPENPIHTLLFVTNEVGEKLGELTVSLSIEDLSEASGSPRTGCGLGDVSDVPSRLTKVIQPHTNEAMNADPEDASPGSRLDDQKNAPQSKPGSNGLVLGRHDVTFEFRTNAPANKELPVSIKEHAIDMDSSQDGSNPDLRSSPKRFMRRSLTDTDQQQVNSNMPLDQLQRNMFSATSQQNKPPTTGQDFECSSARGFQSGALQSSNYYLPLLQRCPSNPELHLRKSRSSSPSTMHPQVGPSSGQLESTRRLFSLIQSQPVDSNVATLNQLLFPVSQPDLYEEPCNVEVDKKVVDSPLHYLSQNEQLVKELFFPDNDFKNSLEFPAAPHHLSLVKNHPPGSLNREKSTHFSTTFDKRQPALFGVNMFVRNLHLSKSPPEQRRLLQPNVVNLHYENCIASSVPQKARSSSRSKHDLPRSRSNSPAVKVPNLTKFHTVRLETSIPIYKTSKLQRQRITSNVLLHRTDLSVDHRSIRRDESKMLSFAPKDSNSELLAFFEIPQPGENTYFNAEQVRFRVYIDPYETGDSAPESSVPLVICLDYLSMDNIRNALFGTKNRDPKQTVAMSLNLFSPAYGSSKATEAPQTSLVLGRLDIELEPVLLSTDAKEKDKGTETLTPLRPHSAQSEQCSPQVVVKTSSQSLNLSERDMKSWKPIPLEIFLSVSQGRGLYLADDSTEKTTEIQRSYVVVRLPWSKTSKDGSGTPNGANNIDRFKSELCARGGQAPSYNIDIRTKCILDEPLLKRLSRSFVVIEVWVKPESPSTSDRLVGLAKVRTNTIVKLFVKVNAQNGLIVPKPESVVQCFLNFVNPTFVVDSWLPVVDLYSGAARGEIHVRLAVGTTQQIDKLNVQAVHTGILQGITGRSDNGFNSAQFQSEPAGEAPAENKFVEHSLTITIENLREFDPHLALVEDLTFAGSVPWGDCDCFVQYHFPEDGQSPNSSIHRTPVQLLVAPGFETLIGEHPNPVQRHLVSCNFATSSNKRWSQTHQVVLRREQDGSNNTVTNQHSNVFFRWLRERLSSNSVDEVVPGLSLELWLRVYSPSLRDRLAAHGFISDNILKNLINSVPERTLQIKRQTRCWVQLCNFHSGQPNGQLGVSLMYTTRPTDHPPPSLLLTDPEQLSTAQEGHVATPPPRLIPNIAHPGVHLRVQLHRLTGLKAAFRTGSSPAFYGHVRLHCVLIYPTQATDSHRNPIGKCLLLGTSTSSPIRDSFFEDNLNMTLEVKLPVSWQVMATGGKAQLIQELSLVELLLNGASSQQMQFTNWISTRWCLMLQVDIWQSGSSDLEQCSMSSALNRVGWNCSDFGEKSRSTWLEPGHTLVSSTRIPLSQLILSRQSTLPGQWHPICKFAPVQGKLSSRAVPPTGGGYFVGGVEVSAGLINGAEDKQRLLEYIAQREQAECLQNWCLSIPLHQEATPRSKLELEPNDRWHSGTDELGFPYKHFTLHLEALRIPSESLLLQETVQCDSEQSSAWLSMAKHCKAFAFVRFTFYQTGTQTSRLIPLNGGTRQETVPVILQVNEMKEYTVPVTMELHDYLRETELELQVWVIWTNTIRDGETLSLEQLATETSKSLSLDAKPFDLPSPRHLGSAHISLSRLLYRAGSPSVPDSGPECMNISTIEGDASGLAWHDNNGTNKSPTPVFPLYRAGADDLYDSWLALRLEMQGSRSRFCASVPTCHTVPQYSSVGALGWNLEHVLKKRSSSTMAYSQVPGTIQTDGFGTENTFPAEVTVEQAFHLRPKTLEEETEKQTPEAESRSQNGFVFVTFPVDGDRSGKLASYVGLWNRLCHSRTSSSRLVATTAKVPFNPRVTWNYRRFVMLPVWLVKPHTRRKLVFHVWFQPESSGDGQKLTVTADTKVLLDPVVNEPQLIGIASVDLTCLYKLFPTYSTVRSRVPGDDDSLDTIYGWYHVVDDAGFERGQLLLGVKPLLPGVSSSNASPVEESLDLLTDRGHSEAQYVNGSTTCLSSQPTTGKLPAVGSLDNLLCRSSSPAQQTTESTPATGICSSRLDLFEQLHKQLNELDAINTKFKQRLAGGDPDRSPVEPCTHRDQSVPQPGADMQHKPETTLETNKVELKWGKGCSASMRDDQACSVPHVKTVSYSTQQVSNSAAVDGMSRDASLLTSNSSVIIGMRQCNNGAPNQANITVIPNLALDVSYSSDSNENVSGVPVTKVTTVENHATAGQESNMFADVLSEHPDRETSGGNSPKSRPFGINDSLSVNAETPPAEHELSDRDSIEVSPLPAWRINDENSKTLSSVNLNQLESESQVGDEMVEREKLDEPGGTNDKDAEDSWPLSHASSVELIPPENLLDIPHLNVVTDEFHATQQRSSSRMTDNTEDHSVTPEMSSNPDNIHKSISPLPPLLPKFFPPSSVLSQVVAVKTDPKDLQHGPPNARLTRLRELRSGFQGDLDGQQVRDEQFESLRRRIDSRISNAMRMINEAMALKRTSRDQTSSDPEHSSRQTPIDRTD